MTFEDSVKKRPYMYIGNDGVVELFARLLTDCIQLCKTDDISFKIIISAENDFSIGFSSRHDLIPFLQHFTKKDTDSKFYLPKVLKIISKKMEIVKKSISKMQINFSFNETLISDINIDYLKLSNMILQVALLNRQTKIITIDKRQKHLNQNYYHFPQGIFYLFEKATAEVLGKPEIKLTFEQNINSNKYQIGLAYRTDWFPVPNIESFANDVHTVCGGSLVDGILDGFYSACKVYAKGKKIKKLNINRKKLLNGLIIVCAVRGNNFVYGGSFKEILEDNEVKKQVQKIIHDLVLCYFEEEKNKAAKFLVRFDETQFASKLY
jgi:DNA gyrase/topoisomerase IV subunit B